jgi:hypothetical protein
MRDIGRNCILQNINIKKYKILSIIYFLALREAYSFEY